MDWLTGVWSSWLIDRWMNWLPGVWSSRLIDRWMDWLPGVWSSWLIDRWMDWLTDVWFSWLIDRWMDCFSLFDWCVVQLIDWQMDGLIAWCVIQLIDWQMDGLFQSVWLVCGPADWSTDGWTDCLVCGLADSNVTLLQLFLHVVGVASIRDDVSRNIMSADCRLSWDQLLPLMTSAALNLLYPSCCCALM